MEKENAMVDIKVNVNTVELTCTKCGSRLNKFVPKEISAYANDLKDCKRTYNPDVFKIEHDFVSEDVRCDCGCNLFHAVIGIIPECKLSSHVKADVTEVIESNYPTFGKQAFTRVKSIKAINSEEDEFVITDIESYSENKHSIVFKTPYFDKNFIEDISYQLEVNYLIKNITDFTNDVYTEFKHMQLSKIVKYTTCDHGMMFAYYFD